MPVSRCPGTFSLPHIAFSGDSLLCFQYLRVDLLTVMDRLSLLWGHSPDPNVHSSAEHTPLAPLGIIPRKAALIRSTPSVDVQKEMLSCYAAYIINNTSVLFNRSLRDTYAIDQPTFLFRLITFFDTSTFRLQVCILILLVIQLFIWCFFSPT